MRFRIVVIAMMLLMLGLAGCAMTSPPTRFYVLSSLEGPHDQSISSGGKLGITVGVGPVIVPAYVDRPQIILRLSPNRLDLAEFDQWAEPVDNSLPRILIENLSKLLPKDTFTVFTWKRPEAADYQLAVDVIRLDASLGGEAILIADWTISDVKSKKTLTSRKTQINKKTKGTTIEDLVAAHSQAVVELSRRMASAISKLK